MAPASFDKFLTERTDAELGLLLSRETSRGTKTQNPRTVRRLYEELKRRGA